MLVQDLAQLKAVSYWRDPIIIVGAGPIGMAVALGLAHYNVPCVVLDDDTGPTGTGSRAFLVDQHTLEILDAWGNLGRQIVELGISPARERIFVRKSALYSTPLAPSQPHVLYPPFVNIPQSVLEHLLFSVLQKMPGCQVLWQHKVTGIDQDSEGADIEVAAPGGIKYLRTPYVLAADGARSSIRRLLGINLPGASLAHHVQMLDVWIGGDEPPCERRFWFDPSFNPGCIAQLNPLPGGIYRVDYQLSADEDLLTISQPAALHKRIIATIGDRPYQVVWMTTHTYHEQVMEHFTLGRVLFLGDAAHVTPPFGCDGLNSGIQDAWNLVWKLVLVRAGLAPETLLDTYENERHAAALENSRLADQTLRFLEPVPGLAHWKRNTNLRLRQLFKFMPRQILSNQLSNFFSYHHSPIFSEDHRLYLGGRFTKLPSKQRAILKRFRQGPLVGSQAPSFVLPDADRGTPVSLSNYFGRGFVALCFCADVEMGMSVLQNLQPNLPDIPIELFVVSQNLPAVTAVDGIHVLVDAQDKAANIYNAGPRTLYLIRPDSYIAARRFDSDLNDIAALLRHAVGEDVVDTQTRMRRTA
jgi:3-(3-hydroxy-phenyl)propionate hydroxylase